MSRLTYVTGHEGGLPLSDHRLQHRTSPVMAPAAVNGDEAAVIGTEEISKPPAGVVLPPKDIRGMRRESSIDRDKLTERPSDP